MAGQVCVAVAIRADEVGAGGTIPLQGCDYLTMDRQFNDKSPVVNQALFNPDWSKYHTHRLFPTFVLYLDVKKHKDL
jgi:hypothetical protein